MQYASMKMLGSSKFSKYNEKINKKRLNGNCKVNSPSTFKEDDYDDTDTDDDED